MGHCRRLLAVGFSGIFIIGAGCRSGFETIENSGDVIVVVDGGQTSSDGSTTSEAPLGLPPFGAGRDGDLVLEGREGEVLNAYFEAVEFDPETAATQLSIRRLGSTELRAKDLIMIIQSTAGSQASPPAIGDRSAIDASILSFGHWELARVDSVEVAADTLRLRFEGALTQSYDATATQVVRIPEYTTLVVHSDSTITGSPWNGRVGGVVALMVNDSLQVDGRIDASALGYRRSDGTFEGGSSDDPRCEALEAEPPYGGGRGESFFLDLFDPTGMAQTGRGNLATGGGGAGAACRGGAGGGSHAGAGASGNGDEGFGGAPLTNFGDKIIFGGAGGSWGGRLGGNGGGVLYVQAENLAGSGSIAANGQNANGDPTGGGAGGGGGGGAGGMVWTVTRTVESCPSLSANGGVAPRGGSQKDGGGGGGGLVRLESEQGSCPATVTAGRTLGPAPSASDGLIEGNASGPGA